jgi:hypothetical protein
MMEVEAVEAECIKVTLTRDGFTASCMVSSWHLTEEKRPQLEAAINRMAAESLLSSATAS